MTITIYPDTDVLGRGEFFACTAENGHVTRNLGPFATEFDALVGCAGTLGISVSWEDHLIAVRLPIDAGDTSYRTDNAEDALRFIAAAINPRRDRAAHALIVKHRETLNRWARG